MYHGLHECHLSQRTYHWHPTLGQIPVDRPYVETLHVYTCEACGETLRLLEEARERFYCRCGRLVGIAAAEGVVR